jgi:hypothetical protein
MKNVLLFASILIACGLLLTNIYNSLIDAKSWGSNIPKSIETARQYYQTVNPGNFFRIFSPVNQVLALLVVIVFWKSSPDAKWFLLTAFILYVLADVFTFSYFYPRNDIMFRTAQLTDVSVLLKTWKGWSTMNWLRSLIIFIGIIFSFISLHKIYMTMHIHYS